MFFTVYGVIFQTETVITLDDDSVFFIFFCKYDLQSLIAFFVSSIASFLHLLVLWPEESLGNILYGIYHLFYHNVVILFFLNHDFVIYVFYIKSMSCGIR